MYTGNLSLYNQGKGLRCLPLVQTSSFRALTTRCSLSDNPRPTSKSNPTRQYMLGALAAVGTLAYTAVEPAQALASTYHMLDDRTLSSASFSIGVASMSLTFLLTSRFILSFHPLLVKAAHRHRGPLAVRMVLLADHFLSPAQQHLFGMNDHEDVNYASMLALAGLCVVLELLFGDTGVLIRSLTDAELVKTLHYLIYFSNTILLPQWAMAVFRYYKII